LSVFGGRPLCGTFEHLIKVGNIIKPTFITYIVDGFDLNIILFQN
jgi:hypothetical protein